MSNDTRKVQTYLEALYAQDFKERPVSVEKFLCDNRFLGRSTEGGQAVYDCWKDALTDFMGEDSKYLGIFTGAIGCLGAEVKVSLLDGRELTIPEIMEERKQGKQHWVYSYDIERGKIVPGKVLEAVLSGEDVDDIIEIELDNKQKILCTANHPFLTTKGIYKKAKELKDGGSLMSLHREMRDCLNT